jgi:hypothetical protein
MYVILHSAFNFFKTNDRFIFGNRDFAQNRLYGEIPSLIYWSEVLQYLYVIWSYDPPIILNYHILLYNVCVQCVCVFVYTYVSMYAT